ncbi:hypothetical protein [Leptospira weilii]|uniref:hypothetical protein n=2 Tax=Leptospira weilii TaxID=28184 RepID=UPI0003172153|nr:hypothetical protein [Leptospira weilii]OMI18395.1 hypothetical protein BUQ74_04590 [Leptospira weilii serovar Heyan]QDK24624.1 hypothetical protein FHG67_19385 [Leptospira weilii]QDK28581.1 hypothetical protein FHG68_19430 [Leptospira weilii]
MIKLGMISSILRISAIQNFKAVICFRVRVLSQGIFSSNSDQEPTLGIINATSSILISGRFKKEFKTKKYRTEKKLPPLKIEQASK